MKFVLILIILCMSVVSMGFAQETRALTGNVSYGGTPVEGAWVVLSGDSSVLSGTSDRHGLFIVDGVTVDQPYSIEVGRFGFLNYTPEEPIVVSASGTASLYINLKRGFNDDAEVDQGWQFGVEEDNATSGVWERAVPQGTFVSGKLAEPDEDASASGQYCFVTGAATADADANETDVDGGLTTLRSPVFSLLDITDPVLQFSYWLSNDLGSNRGGDFFRTQISNDGGVTWINLINSAVSTGDWKPVSITIGDFVTPTDQMLLQFVADDDGLGSLVEAAVDDIAITGSPNAPEPPRDLLLDVQFDQLVLSWKGSEDANGYRVYMWQFPYDIARPEHLFTITKDTTLTIPLADIHYSEFYFQVTAIR